MALAIIVKEMRNAANELRQAEREKALDADPQTALAVAELSGAVASPESARLLARIERSQPTLNAFITIAAEPAMAAARADDPQSGNLAG